MNELLTVDDIAEELRLNEQTVRRFMREKRLPSVRIGRRLYCPRDVLDAMIEKQLQGTED